MGLNIKTSVTDFLVCDTTHENINLCHSAAARCHFIREKSEPSRLNHIKMPSCAITLAFKKFLCHFGVAIKAPPEKGRIVLLSEIVGHDKRSEMIPHKIARLIMKQFLSSAL